MSDRGGRPVSISSIGADDLTTTGRYLAGQLSREEREVFENEVRRDPAVMRTLEATARLKVGLAALRERGELDELLTPEPWYQRKLAWATAAMLLMALLGVMLMRQDSGRTQRPLVAATLASLTGASGSVLPVTAKVAVFRKRADSYDAVIESSPSAGAVELRALPERTVASNRYRLALSRLSDSDMLTAIASLNDLQPADDGFVTVFIDSSQLTAGRYRLDVLGKVPAGDVVAADTFLIRVVPARSD